MKIYRNIPREFINGHGDGPSRTFRELVEQYQTDPLSSWHQMRYHTRLNHQSTLARMVAAHGDLRLSDIRLRTIEEWYLKWSDNKKKVAMGHAIIAKLRTLCHYGAGFLEDQECIRICIILGTRRFEVSKPRQDFLTAEQADAICHKAHEFGYHSIAIAQALQFDIVLRQKDVVGEWVPVNEPGDSDVLYRGKKWLRGLRWSEVDDDLVLRHLTSKVQKPIIVDLKLAPMAYREIRLMPDWLKERHRPMVLCEGTALPWTVSEFRRKWRMIADACGVPKSVHNMDSRSGGITEGTDAGLTLEQMRHAATHSNVTMTARYSRNAASKIAESLKARAAHRAAQQESET